MPGGNVRVMVRLRPMLPRELSYDAAVEVTDPDKVLVYRSNAEFKSSYSHVFSEHAKQEEVYQQVRDGVLSAMQGFNSTIMAYGQTGSGKTYTMMGPHELDLLTARDPAHMPPGTWASVGVVPRALAELFKKIDAVRQRGSARVKVVASYVEIHNDRMYDLLQPYKKGMGSRDPYDVMQRKAALEIREDRSGSTHVPSLFTVEVPSYSAVLQLLAKGNSNRVVRHTEMNVNSSRSHAILQLLIEQWPGQAEGPAEAEAGTVSSHGIDGEASGRPVGVSQMGGSRACSMVVRSKVNFIDLAGSERWNKDTDMGSDRISELTAINSSLSALAGVVSALTGGVARKHVPYRDSKLTSLLQDSLGGNCNTTIIAAISPCVNAFEETVSTLKFADRASSIANNPVVNTARDVGSMLALKEKEIQRLRTLLASFMQQQQQLQQHGSTGSQLPELNAFSSTGDLASGMNASTLPAGASELLAQLEAAKSALELERQWRYDMETRMQRGPQGSAQSLPPPSSSSMAMAPTPRGLSFTAGSAGKGPTFYAAQDASKGGSSHVGLQNAPSSGSALDSQGSGALGREGGARPPVLAWLGTEEQQQQQQQQQQQPRKVDYLRVSTHHSTKSGGSTSVGTEGGELSPVSVTASSPPAASPLSWVPGSHQPFQDHHHFRVQNESGMHPPIQDHNRDSAQSEAGVHPPLQDHHFGPQHALDLGEGPTLASGLVNAGVQEGHIHLAGADSNLTTHGGLPALQGAGMQGKDAWASLPPSTQPPHPHSHPHTMRTRASNLSARDPQHGVLHASLHEGLLAQEHGGSYSKGSPTATSVSRDAWRPGGGRSRPGSARGGDPMSRYQSILAGQGKAQHQGGRQEEVDQRQQQQSTTVDQRQQSGRGKQQGKESAVMPEPPVPRTKAERQAHRSKQLQDVYGSAFSRLAAANNFSGKLSNGNMSSGSGSQAETASRGTGDAIKPTGPQSARGSKAVGASVSQSRPRPNIYGSARVRPRPRPKLQASLSDAAFEQVIAAAHASVHQGSPSTESHSQKQRMAASSNSVQPQAAHRHKQQAFENKDSPAALHPSNRQSAAARSSSDMSLRLRALRSSSGLAAEHSGDLLYNSSDDDFVQQQQAELQQLQQQHEQLLQEQQQQEEEQLQQLREMRRAFQEEQRQQQQQQQQDSLTSSPEKKGIDGQRDDGQGSQCSLTASPDTLPSFTAPPRWGRSSLLSQSASPQPPHASQQQLHNTPSSRLGSGQDVGAALVPSSSAGSNSSSRGQLSHSSSRGAPRAMNQSLQMQQHAGQEGSLLAPMNGREGAKRWGRSALLAM